MTSERRIGIIGAGIAGLAYAKVLKQAGFPVEVFDRAPDVGGVWSVTRRYPGLRAQNTKDTYHFSDFPMPSDYPRVLDGHHMQAYLAAYAEHFGLTEQLRLQTEVLAADPVDSGWLLEVRDRSGNPGGNRGISRVACDHLVIANGAFSDPVLPEYRGTDRFRVAGGRICHSSEFLDLESVRGKSVVVVGYGTSACELATAVSEVAASTSVVARRLLWKMPRTLSRTIDYERLLLTRFGEAHLRSPRPSLPDRFLDSLGESVRMSNIDLLQELIVKRLRLRELGLVPSGRFEEIAGSAGGLVPEGFFEQIEGGRITVHRDTTVTELDGGPHAAPAVRLSTGQVLQADIVVCATGFQQRVPFLTPHVQHRLTDAQGNFRLYRQILPVDVPNVSFAGYNSSAISTLSAEVAAHWTAALLTGGLRLPSAATRDEQIDAWLRRIEEHTRGRHAHGTAVIPFALRNIDEMLADLEFRLPLRTRLAQWFRRIRPDSYRGLATRHTSGTDRTAQAASVEAELLS
ncbi:flavin-containing monooxygenase [Nocardia sp. 004]|uniref:flavin-containing monooxygenase n=1 Tax=Nocardia sp. 004 TaxID=3385978 RepID=UPI0039A34AA0